MKIELLAQNLFQIGDVNVTIYQNDTLVYEFNNILLPKKVIEIIESNKTSILRNDKLDEILKIRDFSEICHFGFMIDNYKIIFGPYLEQEPLASTVLGLKKRLRLIGEESIMVDNFYASLPILLSNNIHFLYTLINHLYNKEPLEYKVTQLQAQEIKISQKQNIDHLFQELEYVKQNYIVEDQFLKVVESGNLQEAEKFLTKSIMVKLPQRAKNDSLRNIKTRLTILNTLCNRAAIRGGIDIQLGHQISTNYGILIENLKSTFDSDRLTREILISYTKSVQDYALKEYPKVIRDAILSIRRHITMKYSLEQLAEDLFLSKEYVARAFKKAVGQTVSNYINQAKILEAKKLLDEGSQSIADLSMMLGYSTSSYFTKVFKQFEGVTPVEYKNKLNK
jgi:AraC-like DNA-binding protein